eukprot:SAG11_NODE_5262_length_1612_cov_1.762723_3_plen_198_part_01
MRKSTSTGFRRGRVTHATNISDELDERRNVLDHESVRLGLHSLTTDNGAPTSSPRRQQQQQQQQQKKKKPAARGMVQGRGKENESVTRDFVLKGKTVGVAVSEGPELRHQRYSRDRQSTPAPTQHSARSVARERAIQSLMDQDSEAWLDPLESSATDVVGIGVGGDGGKVGARDSADAIDPPEEKDNVLFASAGSERI